MFLQESMSFQIADKVIGLDHPPFIIAEMSGNHNQSLERALSIVEAAAAAGAHAIKLQTYTADSLTLNVRDTPFLVTDGSSPWSGSYLYDLYDKAHTPWDWHAPIMDKAKSLGLICFSSPFDESAVDLLESLNVPAYKIASFENNHLPLIKKVAATGKPIILSTGMASLAELEDAVLTLRKEGCANIVLLKCTSTYPANPASSNLLTIPHMRQLFDCEVGLSDHSMGVGVAVASEALGARVIEKHFTLSRSDGGVDSSFSLEPNELNLLVMETDRAWSALGSVHYGPTAEEMKNLCYRRSIYASAEIKPGDVFSESNLKVIRPAGGLPPRMLPSLLGKVANKHYPRGTPIQMQDWLADF